MRRIPQPAMLRLSSASPDVTIRGMTGSGKTSFLDMITSMAQHKIEGMYHYHDQYKYYYH